MSPYLGQINPNRSHSMPISHNGVEVRCYATKQQVVSSKLFLGKCHSMLSYPWCSIMALNHSFQLDMKLHVFIFKGNCVTILLIHHVPAVALPAFNCISCKIRDLYPIHSFTRKVLYCTISWWIIVLQFWHPERHWQLDSTIVLGRRCPLVLAAIFLLSCSIHAFLWFISSCQTLHSWHWSVTKPQQQ